MSARCSLRCYSELAAREARRPGAPGTREQCPCAPENRKSYPWQPPQISNNTIGKSILFFGTCRHKQVPPAARARRSNGYGERASAASTLSARQDVRPFGADSGIELLAGAGHDWKRVAPRPRLAGVDDDPRIARILAAISHGVEHGAPAAAQDFDTFARLEPRAYRPHHLVHVGGIDVVIDHHHDAVGIGAGMALRGNQPGLLGMAAILLLDRDREPQPATAGRVRPHPFDLRYTCGLELVPHGTRAIRAAIE